jgi:AcrR family transcriptional regulator
MGQTMDRRERRRRATVEEIKDTARRQIAESGAASFSMGAVARAMGMTPPALYRYFENRDALVAALVIEAYDSMGEAMEAALDGLPEDDHAGRYLALMRAYRAWGLAHPEALGLMYGASGTDVDLSGERLEQFQRAVMRSMWAMVRVLLAADEAGQLAIPSQYDEPPARVRFALDWMHTILPAQEVPVGILALALTTWIRADGLVRQELHGYLPKALFADGDFFEMESRVLAKHLGLGD